VTTRFEADERREQELRDAFAQLGLATFEQRQHFLRYAQPAQPPPGVLIRTTLSNSSSATQ
jgi:hypothetical protein